MKKSELLKDMITIDEAFRENYLTVEQRNKLYHVLLDNELKRLKLDEDYYDDESTTSYDQEQSKK